MCTIVRKLSLMVLPVQALSGFFLIFAATLLEPEKDEETALYPPVVHGLGGRLRAKGTPGSGCRAARGGASAGH